MSVVIWIQAVWHFDSVPERFLFEKDNFEKSQHAKLSSMQRVNCTSQLEMVYIIHSDPNHMHVDKGTSYLVL